MGAEFLTEPEPAQTPAQILQEQCPLYLSIGMTMDEYWNGAPELAVYYRKAYKLRQMQADQQAWLQGLYFFRACSAAMFNTHPLIKREKPATYCEHPLTEEQRRREAAASDSAEQMNREAEQVTEARAQAAVWMEQLVRSFDKSRTEPIDNNGGEGAVGRDRES